MVSGGEVGHFFLPAAAASAAFFSSAVRERQRVLEISWFSRSAQRTLLLLLAHDGCSILLGFLELCARHGVLGFL